MNYQDFVKRLTVVKPRVLQLVEETEAQFRDGAVPSELKPREGWPFSPKLWAAFYQNTFKLTGVKRIRGAPYATHPTRMAYMLLEVLAGAKEAERSAYYALFHDYLEEGDGRSREGVRLFHEEYADFRAVEAAVVLSEPEIAYDQFPHGRRTMETVAYATQLRKALATAGDVALANAALADKLDNIHDLDYILKNERYSPERKSARLLEKLSIFNFAAEALADVADQRLVALLREAVAAEVAAQGIDAAAVGNETRRFHELVLQYEMPLIEMIDAYHASIGFRLQK